MSGSNQPVFADSLQVSTQDSSPRRCPSNEKDTVRCRLETHDLWDRFRQLGLTEMIITKAGRRMFPSLRVNFEGLEPDALYDVILDVLPVDERRYRYAYHRSAWLVASDCGTARTDTSGTESDGPVPTDVSSTTFRHPDSPYIGRQLEQRTVSFDRVKLTNCLDRGLHRNGYIVLSSMRKYRPRIRLVRHPPTSCFNQQQQQHVWNSHHVTCQDEDSSSSSSFVFDNCVFIAVTAYQNQLITKLKIENNPFAKGFREFSRFGRHQQVEYIDIDRQEQYCYQTQPTMAANVSASSDVISKFEYVTGTSNNLVTSSGDIILCQQSTDVLKQWGQSSIVHYCR